MNGKHTQHGAKAVSPGLPCTYEDGVVGVGMAGTLGSDLAEDAENSGVVGVEKGLPQLARRM